MDEPVGPEEAARFAPGSFGCHEALHMALVLSELVAERLGEHPAVRRDPAWKALADRASDALYDLYQAIGADHLEADKRRGGG
jgi:hypothetical protein